MRARGFLLSGFCVAVALLAAAPGAQAARDLELRFNGTMLGTITLAGNQVLDCPTSGEGCGAARMGVGIDDNSNLDNDAHAMEYVDIDDDEATFNSSSAGVALPPGSQVRWAGLYWGARLAGAVAPLDASANGVVLVEPPGAGGYEEIEAVQVDELTEVEDPGSRSYGAFADVTDFVAQHGAGTYTVANVQAATGAGAFGGWSLLVVFESGTETVRNITVIDGFSRLAGGSSGYQIGGFVVPPLFPATPAAVVAYDGERKAAAQADRFLIGGGGVSDASNPADNFFNSTVSAAGVISPSRNPARNNTLGIDADLPSVQDWLTPGTTSTPFSFANLSSDPLYPHVLAAAIPTMEPILAPVKTVSDLNGGALQRGDELEYTVSAANTGNDTAQALRFEDELPPGLTYVPGSGELDGAPLDSDFEQDALAGTVTAELGQLPISDSTTLTYRVTVDQSAVPGTTFAEQAQVTFQGQQGMAPKTVPSTAAPITLAADPTVKLSELYFCGSDGVAIAQVRLRGKRAEVRGYVSPGLAGSGEVQVFAVAGGKRKLVGSDEPGFDGAFGVEAKAPAKKKRSGTSYEARIAGHRSSRVKLVQPLALTGVARKGNKVVIRGQVQRKSLGSRKRVSVRLIQCGGAEGVGKVRPAKNGKFKLTVPASPSGDAMLFFAKGKVLARPGKKKYRGAKSARMGVDAQT